MLNARIIYEIIESAVCIFVETETMASSLVITDVNCLQENALYMKCTFQPQLINMQLSHTACTHALFGIIFLQGLSNQIQLVTTFNNTVEF